MKTMGLFLWVGLSLITSAQAFNEQVKCEISKNITVRKFGDKNTYSRILGSTTFEKQDNAKAEIEIHQASGITLRLSINGSNLVLTHANSESTLINTNFSFDDEGKVKYSAPSVSVDGLYSVDCSVR